MYYLELFRQVHSVVLMGEREILFSMPEQGASRGAEFVCCPVDLSNFLFFENATK